MQAAKTALQIGAVAVAVMESEMLAFGVWGALIGLPE